MTELKKQDPRKVFSEAIVKLGEKNDKVVAVSCDSASGGGLSPFAKQFPDRFVECGIAEQNAVGVCAGLAKMGMIPYIVVITPFLTMRAYEQVRDDAGYTNMNIKLVGSGGGLAYSTLGSTHETLEDVALMRTIPNMTILTPGDGYEVEQAVLQAAEIDGPVYIRMPRQAQMDILPAEERNYEIGKAEILKKGKDYAAFAFGTSVQQTMRAADLLKEKGIDLTVVDVTTVKPLDRATVLSVYESSKMIFTIEEHSVIGGLGDAVAALIAENKGEGVLRKIGMQESSYLATGPYDEVLDYYNLSGAKLAETIFSAIKE